MPINACALYGASTYTNSWIGINLLIVLVSMLIVAVVYTFSRFLPSRTRGRITDMTRAEITQLILSVLIIAILIGSAATACSISTMLSSAVLANTPTLTSAQKSMSPFTFADYYIGNLALNTGMSLLTNIYSESIAYAIGAQVLGTAGGFLSTLPYASLFTQNIASSVEGVNILRIAVTDSLNFNLVLRILSDSYLALYAPLATIVIGSLFIQYLAIPLLQYTAFVVVLPVALAMRSLSFSGNMLRNTSNAVLAIAIAAYIIYPLTIVFNSYVMYWLFSPANPSYVYLNIPFTLTTIQTNAFYAQNPNEVESITTFVTSALDNSGFTNLFNFLNPFHSFVQQSQGTIDELAELMFQGIVLFAMDLAMTIGFAIGLAKALNSGVEGAGSFWSNM